MTTTCESSIRPSTTAVAGALLLLLTGITPAAPSPASATTPSSTRSTDDHRARGDHRVVHHDARYDVVRFDLASEVTRPAPRDRATDVTRTVVDHRADRLVVQVQARRLKRSGYRLMVAEILTPSRRRFTLVVDYSDRPIDSRVRLERFRSGREVRCAGASWSVSGPARRVDASVPTSCLGDPGWVRVGVGLVASPQDLATSWADDSRARGRVGDQHLRLGPRQHEG